jgi:hypothetical protein
VLLGTVTLLLGIVARSYEARTDERTGGQTDRGIGPSSLPAGLGAVVRHGGWMHMCIRTRAQDEQSPVNHISVVNGCFVLCLAGPSRAVVTICFRKEEVS